MASIYEFSKKIAQSLLPRTLLHQLEPTFRQLAALPYYGRRHQCNICGTQLRTFVQLDRGDALCPLCGSLPRQRRLWHLLQTEYLPKGPTLHFSPPRSLSQKLRTLLSQNYVTTDYEGEFKADHAYDITAIPESEERFEHVICYHVLEHIPDDHAAMKELYRILQTGGWMLVQTPFKTGPVYENEAVTTPEERLQHFGQADHVRIYSVQGLRQRLEKAGFQTKVLKFHESEHSQKHGLKNGEQVIVCHK